MAAEASAYAASAEVGSATAALLPTITLTAGLGHINSLELLFAGGTGGWDDGAPIAQPLFAGGALLKRRNAAKASLAESPGG